MLVCLAEWSRSINEVLGDQKHSLQNFWILTIQEITAYDKLNQLRHERVKLVGVFLSTVMDYGGKSS